MPKLTDEETKQVWSGIQAQLDVLYTIVDGIDERLKIVEGKLVSKNT